MLNGEAGAERAGSVWGRRWWWAALAAGLALRLWFLRHPMPGDDDTDVYAELARNLFHHGVYGIAADGQDASSGISIDPTLIRLPGYPLFLGLLFAVFGDGNFRAVLLAQIAIDLASCWLIASFVREQVGARAGTAAMWLAALCPFTAAYAAMALTECLSVFAVSLALWGAGRLLAWLGSESSGATSRVAKARRGAPGVGAVVATAAGMGLAMLLRPDGVLLSAAVVGALIWYGWRAGRVGLGVRTAAVCGVLAVLPLAPWAMRNWRTFHVVQPLAPRRVNDPGEYVTYGFYRWMSTWSVDFVSTENVFWKVGTAEIDVDDLPARAFGSAAERVATEELLDAYNSTKGVPPALDARFAALAAERVRAHPLLCRLWVPGLRVGDMFLRPRTETLGLDAEWWRFDEHWGESLAACLLGLWNLSLMGMAVWSVASGRVRWAALPVLYVGLRCVLLSTMENSEPRYTLEALPMVLACAACCWSQGQVSAGVSVEEETLV